MHDTKFGGHPDVDRALAVAAANETYRKGMELWLGAMHQNGILWHEVTARTAQAFIDALVVAQFNRGVGYKSRVEPWPGCGSRHHRGHGAATALPRMTGPPNGPWQLHAVPKQVTGVQPDHLSNMLQGTEHVNLVY